MSMLIPFSPMPSPLDTDVRRLVHVDVRIDSYVDVDARADAVVTSMPSTA